MVYTHRRHPLRSWNPWQELVRFRDEVERMLEPPLGRRELPATNVWIGDEGARLVAQVPGLGPDDLDLRVEGERVTLKATRPEEPLAEGERVLTSERSPRELERTFTLPFAIDAEAVRARLADGVLELELPKAASERPKRIPVQAD